MTDFLVDLHCHLDLFPSFEKAIADCESHHIHTLTVTTTPMAWPRNIELTSKSNYVRCALGLHPQLVNERAHELVLWEKYLPDARYVGEIGLDAGPVYYKSIEEQIRVFEYMLKACSEAGNKVLSIHSVRTVPKILELVEKTRVYENNKIILHWFTGSLLQAKKASDLGCFFSVNHQMLNNEKHLAMIRSLPTGKIITETDAPFTFDVNGKTSASNISLAVGQLAKLWNISFSEAQKTILDTLALIES